MLKLKYGSINSRKEKTFGNGYIQITYIKLSISDDKNTAKIIQYEIYTSGGDIYTKLTLNEWTLNKVDSGS